MKKSNTYQSSFSHNDAQYSILYDSRYDMADDDDKLEDAVSVEENNVIN